MLKMTVAYACDWMCMCVNFSDEILLRGEECKTPSKFEFFQKNGKTVNCLYNTSCKPKNFLYLG